ncbi:thiopurine S-methyltransferase-like [Babylonia areolata]|uniref:thiopurine S-methyltransferase-like n=1 Tax=Babylonia areolata TaxID=304850 RepID=UPI003FD3FFC2
MAGQGSGAVQSAVLTNQDWVQFWEQPNPGFHKPYVNPTLKKHLPLLLAGRSNLRILVPLCGKSWDMKWLADQGHTVVGVEVVPRAIEEFFSEQKVAFTTSPAPAVEGTLYQSKDKKLQLYCCDIFKVSPKTVGQFDAIWDRAGMDAVNRKDRAKYVEVLQSLMAPGCRCLMAALQYDETKHAGPPHHVSDEAVHEAFKAGSVVKEVGSEDATKDILESWEFDKMTERVFLITPK